MLKRAALLLLIAATAIARDPNEFAEMRWRMIGPFRGGRTVAAVGVRGQPGVFYIGVNNGGVWKTNDAGRSWSPIFDQQPTGSIGAIAVAPSNPNIVYVGSGEGLQRPDLSTGDGIYKSSDAGRSWQHLGLRDGQQIPMIAVDPRDPNRVYVAVLGHPYGPNEERGVFRSTDGGNAFQKVLYKDENTGGMDVAIDPANPDTVYAVLWQARQGPWENGAWTGPNSGLFKSTDGGANWKQLTNGLPGTAEGLGRIGIEVSQADHRRLYAVVGAAKNGGIYRSDDAGESWRSMNTDNRLWGRDGDFNEIRSDPKNADVVYVANVVTWKSTDGGKTWASFRGAPGGDDYHRLWINPDDPKIIINASDQGAIITLNGGESWSSWYNQPSAQFYHVNADNDFPYRVCGGQQESGSACVQSRGDDGQITFREWHPVGVEEYGYAVPDPLDPNIIFGGKLERYDRRSGQVTQVAPRPLRGAGYRVIRTQPVVFSPVDPHILYFASNTLWKTTDRGQSWTEISPDLTRKTWSVPATVGVYTPKVNVTQRGVIYALAPSPLDINRIWAGTDDGLIHVTTDGGKTWADVTPPQLTAWSKVSIMEASHFDPLTAYAAINTFRLDDLRPHVLRTRDGGKSWTEIVNGIPAGGIINAVREDPKKRGLLFSGSEQAVYVSFDDGDRWQSLRLNMPASSIRDLTIHDDDLIAATHGRGFWILDDLEPLRQDISGNVFLFKPAQAWRFRWNKNTDTPLPPDEPAGQNPPDGAIIDFVISGAPPTSAATLEIFDSANNLVRRYSSADRAEPPKDTGQWPWYWIRPTQVLSAAPGMHRFVWDLHYTPAPGTRVTYPIAAIAFNTAPSPSSPWVMPGTYTVKLTANGKSVSQALVVKMDPRVKTPSDGLQQQFALSKQIYDAIVAGTGALEQLRGIRTRVAGTPLAAKGGALEGAETEDFGPPPAGAQADTFNGVLASLRSTLALLQGSDVTPSAQLVTLVRERQKAFDALMQRWKDFQTESTPH
ncbi:MAG TPA: glycoside hydrolase [Thermoanaerobaculia bacterium]|nr:glycoside hydrolase [Thermoanaerobaculia bacterium]